MKLYKSEVLLAGREKERERECDKNFILKLPTLDQSEASIQVTWVLSTNQSTGKTAKRERESFYRNFLAEKTFGFCVSQNFFPTLLFVIIIILSKLPGFCFTLLSSVQVIYLNILCAIKNQMTKGPLTLSILNSAWHGF